MMPPRFGDDRLPQRFWSKVRAVPSGCWVWTGARSEGYGRFSHNGVVQPAHRVTYLTLVGPIAAGLHIDHLCRNRSCVNPEHLEPVTPRENVLRGIGPSAQHAMKTHCPAGHPYSAANTYLYRGMRMCRACRAELGSRSRESRAARTVRAEPNDPRHGLVGTYTTYGCRCEKCRAAWREYQRAYKARRARAG